MKYLLDTNICIAHLNRRDPEVRDRLIKLNAHDVFLCSVVKAELIFGARKSAHVQKNLTLLGHFFAGVRSLPFDDHAAELYGNHAAHLAQAGRSIGSNDLMIASIAQAHNLIVATRNDGEFMRIPGLRVSVW